MVLGHPDLRAEVLVADLNHAHHQYPRQHEAEVGFAAWQVYEGAEADAYHQDEEDGLDEVSQGEVEDVLPVVADLPLEGDEGGQNGAGDHSRSPLPVSCKKTSSRLASVRFSSSIPARQEAATTISSRASFSRR